MVPFVSQSLCINEKEFMSLPQRQQMCTLYQNQVNQFEKLDRIENLIRGYKLHQGIQYGWLTGITAIGTYLTIKYVLPITNVVLPMALAIII